MASYARRLLLSNRHAGGGRYRRKGDRVEREVVSRHAAIGVKAERYPLIGASRFRGSGHDIDIYAFGRDEGPLVAEVKSRRSGAGFVTLEKMARRLRLPVSSSEQRGADGASAMAGMGGTACEGAPMTARSRLPNRRPAESLELEVDGLRYTATVGSLPDGSIGELFLSNHRSNSSADTAARDSAIVLSTALQHGTDLETIQRALCRDSQGRASGPLGAALDIIMGCAVP